MYVGSTVVDQVIKINGVGAVRHAPFRAWDKLILDKTHASVMKYLSRMRGSSTMILCALENRSASFLSRGRTYSPPRWGGGISVGNRALSEGNAAVATA